MTAGIGIARIRRAFPSSGENSSKCRKAMVAAW
jgi:hypothetical protein